MNGIFTSVSTAVESSIFAFSAASSRRWRASGSLRTSMPLSFWNSVAKPVDYFLVDIFAAQVCVAVGRAHLDRALVALGHDDLKHRDVEGAAAKVEDDYLFVLLFVKSVGKRCCGWLVDDALNLEPAILPASRVAARCASLK
jgi:hypothetical protein